MKLPKTYEPKEYEADIYALWEKAEAFAPKNRDSKDTYSLVVPPPNANGDLHLGHGLTLVLEDIAARYHRMKGESTLFLPGADHAGFETQVVYEKKLAKEGKSRFDFSREELYAQIWDFVALNRANFETQIRHLGASVDWKRFTYTLDDKIIKRAYATFKKMWDDKLIYRGERLVNFCTFHGTGFADIEVEYKEEQSNLWHIDYPLSDGSGSLTVATTRPETMLGDVAVAVNPKDARYQKFIGKTVKLPLTQREIPVIADKMVDEEFGTGAVKITPAHDPNDFDVAERHDLPKISVIDHEGKLTHDVPLPYRGLSVEQGREAVIKDLEGLGLLKKKEAHNHSVGHCYKCGTVIQPLLREQWFVDMQPLATEAIRALREDKIKFYPAGKKDQLISYLKGLRDWNISRQIAWGIPIPAFQSLENPDKWIYDERVEEEIIEVKGRQYRRDPDVFDTWFSSASWPYATLDYPDSEDFKQFYPLSLMETGSDILYPWVSRMLMFGLYNTGQVPFEAVYLHGMIQDEHGAKMSKSKGNVINPMDKLDEYGSDAFRMGIVATETAGSNRPFDPSKLVGARNFANKLWNIARYIEDKAEGKSGGEPKTKTAADRWILNKLNFTTGQVSKALDDYHFSEAYETLYHFVWDDFADWYLEASKIEPNGEVLVHSLKSILKLAHPFAPFVTETIWQTLSGDKDSLLAVEAWPNVGKTSGDSKDFEEIRAIVSEIRLIKSVLHRQDLNLYHLGDDFFEQNGELIRKMAGLNSITVVKDGRGLNLTGTKHHGWLDVDYEDAKHFLDQLLNQREGQAAKVKRLEDRLANKAYVKSAPKEIVDETKAQLEETREALAKITEEHERFSSSVG